ncbi:MAG: DUF4912 domain-containing protein [Planctomycetales bacterium]|nr:DUF4912 domain-containing protein [Planctomycetales bacterium]MBN8624894.1 DUF4912 domain-containing protein [Planctomycetota bacterium]
MTADTLNSYSAKDLAEMAKNRGVPGWHSMRKEQLIKALVKAARQKSNKVKGREATRSAAPARVAPAPARVAAPASKPAVASKKGAVDVVAVAKPATNGKPVIAAAKPIGKPSANGSVNGNGNGHVANGAARPQSQRAAKPQPPRDPEVTRRIEQVRSAQAMKKDLAYLSQQIAAGKNGRGIQKVVKDRLVVMVRDSYWLQAHWELSRNGVERAQAALGQEWHAVKPVLRLMEVADGGTTSAVETKLRDIEIHGGVNNWYIDVQDPPKSFRVDIGYVTAGGRFYSLARSNVVTTPRAGNKDDIDQNWTDIATDFERIYAQSGGYNGDGNGSVELQEVFEERLRRPMGSSLISRFGPGVDGLLAGKKPFHFEIDAELIVFGKTDPDAKVTLQNEPIKLRPDGTFTVRYSLPNARQVIPAVAASANGLEQRTVVLAVERNTKAMEPLVRDQGNNSSPE